MPVYTYQVVRPDGSPGETFDVIHGMNDPPLSVHPQTGEPVQRIFTPPHIAGWGNSRQAKHLPEAFLGQFHCRLIGKHLRHHLKAKEEEILRSL